MAVHNGNGLAYKHDVQTWSVYELHVEGKVVLEAAVNNADPELKIHIGRGGATFAQVQLGEPAQLMETEGRAAKGIHPVLDAAGLPDALSEHVDGTTVQSFVYPRALRFLVELYVPLDS